MPETINLKSNRGGRRPGAGRPKGAKDRATADLKTSLEELARSHAPEALQVLVSVARASESDAARVSAANAILDRGYGKPRQAMEHTGADGGPIEVASDHDLAKLIAYQLFTAAEETAH